MLPLFLIASKPFAILVENTNLDEVGGIFAEGRIFTQSPLVNRTSFSSTTRAWEWHFCPQELKQSCAVTESVLFPRASLVIPGCLEACNASITQTRSMTSWDLQINRKRLLGCECRGHRDEELREKFAGKGNVYIYPSRIPSDSSGFMGLYIKSRPSRSMQHMFQGAHGNEI